MDRTDEDEMSERSVRGGAVSKWATTVRCLLPMLACLLVALRCLDDATTADRLTAVFYVLAAMGWLVATRGAWRAQRAADVFLYLTDAWSEQAPEDGGSVFVKVEVERKRSRTPESAVQGRRCTHCTQQPATTIDEYSDPVCLKCKTEDK
jgi:hypothetical protein